mmetsp:Transcript_16059/g.32332  ORF Transcript_16059/g.32332 Transcript_16059/m.32332 type:complete len:86 (+) Transcript_16059:2187-2444(+)
MRSSYCGTPRGTYCGNDVKWLLARDSVRDGTVPQSITMMCDERVVKGQAVLTQTLITSKSVFFSVRAKSWWTLRGNREHRLTRSE